MLETFVYYSKTEAFTLLYITHSEKYMRTTKARGLKQKNVKNLHELKKAVTKIITILLNQKKEKDSQKINLQLKYNNLQLLVFP